MGVFDWYPINLKMKKRNVMIEIFVIFCCFLVCWSEGNIANLSDVEDCFDESCGSSYDPATPLVLCHYLPLEFLSCQQPVDFTGNETARDEFGHGCTKWGGEKYADVQTARAVCQVLPGIECHGKRTFLKDGFPCIKYTGHYFLSTLIYSVLLGFLGLDRFCLGHTGTAVGKLLTLGGVGIWWIVDIILLVTGDLKPADGSNWMPFY